jgi:hypothetical protein
MFDIQPTEEVKAMADLTVMNNHSDFALSQFIEYSTHAYRAFWYGDASPIVKVAMLGTKAQEVFTSSAAAQAFIKSVKPDHIELGIPNGYVITWAEDGSATLEYTEPESQPAPQP